MLLESKLRKLARKSYWQSLYRFSKISSNIQLFENTVNFSGLQVWFLNWLRIYNDLYKCLARKEDDLLSMGVLEDDIRTDAYLIYLDQKLDKENKKLGISDNIKNHDEIHDIQFRREE